MKKIFSKPKVMTDEPTTYCPGCGHGIAHRLIGEVIDELGIAERTIAIWPVGCAVFGYKFFNLDGAVVAHGRATAVATGLKRADPSKIVFTYQGDGDLAAIGTNNTLHTANRGENFTTIFINNATYGMTGGQMAPTTLVGQKATTCPYGRSIQNEGYPIRMCELLNTLEAPVYLAREALIGPSHIRKAKKMIKRAFKLQIERKGFSLVELLSSCPTNLRLSPGEAFKWVEKNMVPYFPLGEFRTPEGGKNA